MLNAFLLFSCKRNNEMTNELKFSQVGFITYNLLILSSMEAFTDTLPIVRNGFMYGSRAWNKRRPRRPVPPLPFHWPRCPTKNLCLHGQFCLALILPWPSCPFNYKNIRELIHVPLRSLVSFVFTNLACTQTNRWKFQLISMCLYWKILHLHLFAIILMWNMDDHGDPFQICIHFMFSKNWQHVLPLRRVETWGH